MGIVNGDSEFLARIDHELEACRVSRDNLVHQRLVGGFLTARELREWGRQQYIFHRSLPATLSRLDQASGRRPAGASSFLAFLARAEAGTDTKPGRLRLWASACRELGLHRGELRDSRPLPATEVMIAIQRYVTSESFGQGFAGLVIGVILEAADFSHDRRQALKQHYGVSEDGLGYFTAWPIPIERGDLLRLVAESCSNGEAQDDALRAIRMVLRTRWAYFNAIGAGEGQEKPHPR